MKKYVVLKYMKELEVAGMQGSFPNGHGFLPVFDNYSEAKEHAGDKYEILVMKTNADILQEST